MKVRGTKERSPVSSVAASSVGHMAMPTSRRCRMWYMMFRSVVLFPVPRFPMSSTVAASAMVLKSKARMFSFCIVGGCVFILVTLKFFLYGGAVHRPRHTARCAAPSRLPAAALGAVGELRGHVQHRGCVARRAHDGGHARRRAHAAGRGLPPPRREGGHRVHAALQQGAEGRRHRPGPPRYAARAPA